MKIVSVMVVSASGSKRMMKLPDDYSKWKSLYIKKGWPKI